MIVSGRSVIAAVAAMLILAGSSPAAAADDVRVRAYVEPEGRVVETQAVRLVVQIEGSQLPRIDPPRLPKLANLKVVGGPDPQSMSSMRFDGLQTTRSETRSFTFTMLPVEPGPAEVPPISVAVGSSTYRTETIRFDVVKGSDAPRPSLRRDEGAARGTGDAVPLLLRAKLGASEAWVGEPVSLDVTLFAAIDVLGFDWVERPSFQNFWVEDLRVDPGQDRYRARVGDRLHVAYPLSRLILVPTTPGEYTVDPYAVRVQVPSARRDFFDDFFSFRRGRSVIRRSEPLELTVKALPEAGRPDGFSGAVGSFRLEAEADRTEARVNDAVALKVTVEGEGFLKSAPAPDLEAVTDFRVYDPEVSDSMDSTSGKLRSRKTWEWLLVPLSPGEIRLPRVRFAYFDPELEEYKELVGEPGSLVVQRGDTPIDATVARGDVRLQRREIAFIKPLRGRLATGGARIQQREWFPVLVVLPWILAPVVVFVGRRRARYARDLGLARARRARARARKRLRSAQRRMAQVESGQFHEAVARVLVDYVADRFNRSPSGLTYDIAEELLTSGGVSAEMRRRFRSCLETCDFARFVPASGETGRKSEVLEEATEIVESLERALT